jgi:hypothetical protein
MGNIYNYSGHKGPPLTFIDRGLGQSGTIVLSFLRRPWMGIKI